MNLQQNGSTWLIFLIEKSVQCKYENSIRVAFFCLPKNTKFLAGFNR